MWRPIGKLPIPGRRRRKQQNVANGFLLSKPVTKKENCEHFVTTDGLTIGHASMQGYRVENEDCHLIGEIIEGITICAVFDGHAGAGAGRYAASNMIRILTATKSWNLYTQKKKLNEKDILGNALIEAYKKLDEEFYESLPVQRGVDRSGCTAVCALITSSYIICASVGDSRCIVGSTDGEAIALSFDHKPSNPREQKRIIDAGGAVVWNRVNGELAMSRAFGDFQYKVNKGLLPENQMVVSIPDVHVHKRSSRDAFLILACDGVWDVISNSQSVLITQELFNSVKRSGPSAGNLEEEVAKRFLDLALNMGSTDNISAIIVKL